MARDTKSKCEICGKMIDGGLKRLNQHKKEFHSYWHGHGHHYLNLIWISAGIIILFKLVEINSKLYSTFSFYDSNWLYHWIVRMQVIQSVRIQWLAKQRKNYLPMQRSMVWKSMDTQKRLGMKRFQKTRNTLEVW